MRKQKDTYYVSLPKNVQRQLKKAKNNSETMVKHREKCFEVKKIR